MRAPNAVRALRFTSIAWCLLVTGQTHAREVVGRVAAVTGRVDWIRAGASVRTKSGDAFEVGDVLKTADKGRAKILFDDGTVLNLGDATRLDIIELTLSRRALVGARLGLKHGSLHAFVAPRSLGKLTIAAGTFALVPRGVDVMVREAVRGTQIFVAHGALEARPAGAPKGTLLCAPTAGQQCFIARRGGAVTSGAANRAAAEALRAQTHVAATLGYRALSRAKTKRMVLKARAAFSQGKKAKAATALNKSGDVGSLVGAQTGLDPVVPPLSPLRVQGRVPTSF